MQRRNSRLPKHAFLPGLSCWGWLRPRYDATAPCSIFPGGATIFALTWLTSQHTLAAMYKRGNCDDEPSQWVPHRTPRLKAEASRGLVLPITGGRGCWHTTPGCQERHDAISKSRAELG